MLDILTLLESKYRCSACVLSSVKKVTYGIHEILAFMEDLIESCYRTFVLTRL